MDTPSEKWKRGLSKAKLKLSKRHSNVSLTSQISVMEEETSEREVEAYLTTLKNKSGLKNLWSGHKFEGYVDGDRTPDISTDTDDELDLKLSMNANHFRQLSLDSDEDEMRIDYMREASLNKIDENNNQVDSDDDKPVNLMQNIHFAELEIGEIELSDRELKTNKPDDFMPQIYTLNVSEKEESSSEFSQVILRNNIRMLDDVSSEESNSISSQVSVNNLKSEVSIPTMSAEELSKTEKDVSEASKIHSNSSKHSQSKSGKNDYSSSNFESNRSSPYKTKSKSKRSKSRSNYTYSDTESESQSNTLVSTSSISTDNNKKSRKSKHSHDKSKKKHRSLKTTNSSTSPKKHAQTQTIQTEDLTDEVLKFRYTWKRPSPSNIAVHAVDMAAMDVLTNYNPATLAANDMLKFHLDLLKKHITDSQRLYEAYAGEDLNKKFNYTTIQDTMKYIEKNRPAVITYEEALKEIKNGDGDS